MKKTLKIVGVITIIIMLMTATTFAESDVVINEEEVEENINEEIEETQEEKDDNDEEQLEEENEEEIREEENSDEANEEEIIESKEIEIPNLQIKNNSQLINLTATNAVTKPTLTYQSHVQDIGWQEYKSEGQTSGTSGRSLRLEGIRIKLSGSNVSGSIKYTTHVQNIGWQSYVTNNNMSGTTGRSLRLEAIKIELTGDIANYYDIYYRTHVQEFGWLDWAKNGEESGSAGYSYRMEAIEIKLVEKGKTSPSQGKDSYKVAPPRVSYETHVQSIGWQGLVNNGTTSGTTGRSLRLEGIRLYVDWTNSKGIEYSAHVQNIGWQNYVSDGTIAGTTGNSLRLEAIKIRLKNELANQYDIYYRVHCEHFGWLDWAKNDEKSGSEGYGYRLEAIQVKLVKKGESAPGKTANPYFNKADEPTGLFFIDTTSMVQTPKNTLNVTGWSLATNSNTELKFYIDDNLRNVSVTRIERADVLKAYPNYDKTVNAKPGFVTSIDMSPFTDGNHVLKIQLVSIRSNIVLQETKRNIQKYSNVYIGIDVSEHNGNIDWAKVKTQVDFAIVRCGYGMDKDDYGGYSQDDSMYKTYMDECRKYGIPVAIYLYSYADSTARASSEADHVIRLAANYKDIIKKVWYDVEEEAVFTKIRNGSLSKDTLQSIIDTFANKVKSAGYQVGLYSGASALTNYFTDDVKSRYDIWMAHYTGANVNNFMSNMSSYNVKYSIWQFSSTGSISGISGNVDMNASFVKFW